MGAVASHFPQLTNTSPFQHPRTMPSSIGASGGMSFIVSGALIASVLASALRRRYARRASRLYAAALIDVLLRRRRSAARPRPSAPRRPVLRRPSTGAALPFGAEWARHRLAV